MNIKKMANTTPYFLYCILPTPLIFTQESRAQRSKGNKADSEFLTYGQRFCFTIPRPQGVFVLERSERLDCMRPPDGLHPGFRLFD
jgi:hypothetical protein